MQFTLLKTAKNVYEYQSSTQESLTDTTSTPQVQSKIFHSRVSSVHLNMLSKVTISRQQLKLIEIIGQGYFSHAHTHTWMIV